MDNKGKVVQQPPHSSDAQHDRKRLKRLRINEMHDVECLLSCVLLQTSKDNMLHLIQCFMFLLELYVFTQPIFVTMYSIYF